MNNNLVPQLPKAVGCSTRNQGIKCIVTLQRNMVAVQVVYFFVYNPKL